MKKFLIAFFCFLNFAFFALAESFYELKPNQNYSNESLSLDYMPFHNFKTITYVNKTGSDYLYYKYNNSLRKSFINLKGEKIDSNISEKFGTLKNFFVLYDPKLNHKYSTYWPIDAKVGDTWKGEIYYCEYQATLAEFGDMVFDNKKIKYAKIIYEATKSDHEGFAIFGKDIGLIEFNFEHTYLRLKPFN